jgi:hypothetical protein
MDQENVLGWVQRDCGNLRPRWQPFAGDLRRPHRSVLSGAIHPISWRPLLIHLADRVVAGTCHLGVARPDRQSAESESVCVVEAFARGCRRNGEQTPGDSTDSAYCLLLFISAVG